MQCQNKPVSGRTLLLNKFILLLKKKELHKNKGLSGLLLYVRLQNTAVAVF